MLGAGCSWGDATVSLGDSRPPLYHFGPPRLLAELDATFANENASLTADLLELVFSSGRGPDGTDVWVARRDSPTAVFGAPVRIDEASSPLHETSPAISLDGLTVYFGSDRPGGLGDLDIWRVRRTERTAPWGTAENLTALNSDAKDVPRAPGQHDLVMPLGSERANPGAYQTYLAARARADGDFALPVLISELSFPGETTVDAFLSDDGLTLLYASAPVGMKLDLFVAWRKTTWERFSVRVPIADLNSDGDERDPWLSPDGKTFYFTSDRTGVLQIYEAAASRGPAAGQ